MKRFKIYCFFLALFPILDVYSSFIPSISIGQLVLFSISSIFFLEATFSKKFKFDNRVLFFLIYSVLISFLCLCIYNFDLGEVSLSLFSQVFYIFLLLVGFNFFKYGLFSKYYIHISVVVSVISLVQYYFFTFFSIKILFLIPGFPLEIGVTRDYLIKWFSRITGCFSEPAHLSQFLSISLLIVLAKKRLFIKDYLTAGLFALVCILTKTGNAIISLSVIFVLFVCIRLKVRFNMAGVAKILAVFSVLVFVFMSLYFTNQNFKELIDRVNEITGQSETSISGYVRVLRGYELFSQFSLHSQLFGIGLGNVGSYCKLYNINGSIYVDPNNGLYNYLNGIQYYLISLGVVGFALYFLVLFRAKKITRLFILSFALIFTYSLVAAMYTSPVWLILMLITIDSQQMHKSHKLVEELNKTLVKTA